jgi:hypothetical protein
MDAELSALEQRRDKTRDLKQAMMQHAGCASDPETEAATPP